MTENNNREYWDKLNETNPALTKEFNKFGKTLTTIDPHYQIMKMTEVFGPVGKGWAYDSKYWVSEKVIFGPSLPALPGLFFEEPFLRSEGLAGV